MQRRLFIGIGVQKPIGMQDLPGVHDAVRRMGDYARRNGTYDDPILLLDEPPQIVDYDLVRAALEPEILAGRPRIMVYFCGHGAFLNGREIWYLSDGQNQWRQRVDVSAFRDMLASYGPRQICIFSDACQTAVVHSGSGSPILDQARGSSPLPKIDTFRATIEGEAAYATTSDGPLFSHCIARVLATQPPAEAIDQQYRAGGRYVVSSQSLGDYLEMNLPDYAALVGKEQHPDIVTGLRFDTNDYLELTAEDSAKLAPEGGFLDKGKVTDLETEPEVPAYKNHGSPKAVAAELKRRRERKLDGALEAMQSEWRQLFWEEALHLADSVRTTAQLIVRIRGDDSGRVRDLIASTALIRPSGESLAQDLGPSSGIGGHYLGFQIDQSFTPDKPLPPLPFGILRIGDSTTPLQLHRDLTCILSFDLIDRDLAAGEDVGVQALGWYDVSREHDSKHDPDRLGPMQALKGLMTGVLGANLVGLVAARLRRVKHADPLYGIVAAYLYDRAGDIDSIRRVCAFYSLHGQAVPFDIALLARVPMDWVPGLGLFIDIPEIAEDPVAREAELPSYVWQSMESVEHVPVAGLAPILSAGWARLATLSQTDLHQYLARFNPYLAEAPFATLLGDRMGARLIDFYHTVYERPTQAGG